MDNAAMDAGMTAPGSEQNPSNSRFNVQKVPSTTDNNTTNFSNSSIANLAAANTSNTIFHSSTTSTSNDSPNNANVTSNTVPKKKTEKQNLLQHQHSLEDSQYGSRIGELALYDEDFNARPQINTVIQKALRQKYNPMGDQSDVKNHEDEEDEHPSGANLGTLMGVYLPTIQNIFGVILFIRMAWIVGCAGTATAFLIVFLCCLTTMLTAFSMSAIATNGVVPAGGAYFMISRSLGPEFGGAVGILFYLATTFGSAMYILGAIEIIIVYISQAPSLWLGNTPITDATTEEDKAKLFFCMRVYGTILLLLMSSVVFVGVKYVNKLASFFLLCVIVSILTIYAGVIKLAISPNPTEVCLIGNRLLSSPANWTSNSANCGPIVTPNDNSPYEDDFCIMVKTVVGNETVQEMKCNSYYSVNNITAYQVVRGFSGEYSAYNWESKMKSEPQIIKAERVKAVSANEEVVDDESDQLSKATSWIMQSSSSMMVFMAIFFPSVTGIMAGSNRSGDLADPSKSIPTGTICAIGTTSTVYLSTILLLGACVDNVLLRDKFGSSINQGLVMAQVTWPTPWIMIIGSCMSSIGAGLQSLTGAPRLLQAIAKDNVMPILKPLAKGKANGDPSWSLFATICISEIGILIADLDAVAPIITIFFLSCYMFVNFACALQTLMDAPSWRPRFKFYHWGLSSLGVFMCIVMCFITGWTYTLVVLMFAVVIYKYIEYKGAEQEWGDGLKGLQMSTARYALTKLEQGPPHTKNWRPQLLVLAKLDDTSLKMKSTQIFNFCQQLKAGKGFFQLAAVIEGDILQPEILGKSKAANHYLKNMIAEQDLKGFTSVLVSKNVSEGISSIVQTAGLGGLRHNTIVCGWPDSWKSKPDRIRTFINTIRTTGAANNALLVPKNIDLFPSTADKVCTGLESRSKKGDVGKGVPTGASQPTIDVWWIVHDGGLLMLLPHLLKQHKVWKGCKTRIFTVAQKEDNSIKMRDDLKMFLYHLRIEAEIEIVELDNTDISAYTYERTMVMEQRMQLLKDIQNTPQVSPSKSPMRKLRSNSRTKVRIAESDPTLIANQSRSQTNLDDMDMAAMEAENQKTWMPSKQSRERLNDAQEADLIGLESNDDANNRMSYFDALPEESDQEEEEEEEENNNNNNDDNTRQQATAADMSEILTVKPRQSNVKRMHNAVKLNEVVLSKSHAAALVILNLPTPPKGGIRGARDSAYMEFLEVLTEGLERVLLIRGCGREVITMYS